MSPSRSLLALLGVCAFGGCREAEPEPATQEAVEAPVLPRRPCQAPRLSDIVDELGQPDHLSERGDTVSLIYQEQRTQVAELRTDISRFVIFKGPRIDSYTTDFRVRTPAEAEYLIAALRQEIAPQGSTPQPIGTGFRSTDGCAHSDVMYLGRQVVWTRTYADDLFDAGKSIFEQNAK